MDYDYDALNYLEGRCMDNYESEMRSEYKYDNWRDDRDLEIESGLDDNG